jgi:hypothetical protein
VTTTPTGDDWAGSVVDAIGRLGRRDPREVVQAVPLPSAWMVAIRSDQSGKTASSPLLRRLLDEAPALGTGPAPGVWRPAGTHEERLAALEEYLRNEFARLLGLPVSAVTLDRPVTSFGLDSLMAIQLKNRVETDLGVTLSIVTMLEGLSLTGIAGRILEELDRDAEEAVEHSRHRNGFHASVPGELHSSTGSNGHSNGALLAARPTIDDFDDLTESELDQMIDDLISLEDGFDGLTELA